MGELEGRVAIVTGAGRGLGREHALLMAREGASVVVNDLGGGVHGDVLSEPVAQQVVDEIVRSGGRAVASADDVSDFEGARHLVDQAINHFGGLDVLVNNAAILRDSLLEEMTEQEWDDAARVNLKGTFAPMRWAGRYWKHRFQAGKPVRASVINTSSTSGLFGTPGQANYGASKAGVAALTLIAAREWKRYGIRVNSIAPQARTRAYTAAFAEAPDKELMRAHIAASLGTSRPDGFDHFTPEQLSALAGSEDEIHPRLVAPLVVYLATESCPFSGECFEAGGRRPVTRLQGWTRREQFGQDGEWGVEEFRHALGSLEPIKSTPR
jgi:NAD(P)-dependent dehydrogenase (short-subunit alcohol dehydrogenase family)